jgi:DNA-binding Lrp family transcriptional regulator
VVDDADRAIIDLLCDDGRMSNRELAARVGFTEVTVATRLRRLQEAGIFRVNAVVDWAAAGYSFGLTFMIAVEGQDTLETAAEIASDDAVYMVALTFGSVDVIAYALVAGYDDIDRLTRRFKVVPGVSRLSVDLQYESLKWGHRYALVGHGENELRLPAPVIPLDDLDEKILRTLVRDGHASNRTIARRLGASEGTIRSRLRRLEEANLLRIRGQVDPVLAGELSALCMIAVTLDGRNDADAVQRINDLPIVLASTRTTGTFQLMISAGATDSSALVRSILRDLRTTPGVVATETWEVIRFVKQTSHFARFH